MTTGKLWVPGWKHPTAVQIVWVSQGGTNFVAIGTSGYYGAQITVTNALDTNNVEQATSHTVISSQPVGVEFHGFTDWDAYGCFGGVVK